MFTNKVGAYPSEASIWCSTPEQAVDLTLGNNTRPERPVRDKPSSLLLWQVKYGGKKFFNVGSDLLMPKSYAFAPMPQSTT